MVEERFINFFEFAGLDPAADREKNYELLKKMRLEMTGKKGPKADMETDILDQAKEIFNDQVKYDNYMRRWQEKQPKRPEAGPVNQPEAASTRPSEGLPQKGLKAMLIEIGSNAVKNAVKNAIENKMNPASAGLTGVWHDNFGCVLQVRQRGNNIAIVVKNGLGYVLSQGTGVLTGNKIDYQARDGVGQFGKGEFWVSPDGARIEGHISWYSGNSMPTGSSQVVLVRS
jgi:hypothetical protein